MNEPHPKDDSWTVKKSSVKSKNGIVVSQHYLASAIGTQILDQGGNAIDAAVAAGLAIGCVEPWMSGIGGGGYLLYAPSKENIVHAVEFGMVSPKNLDPGDYPLTTGVSGDIFGWPGVLDDRNTHGYYSIAVPGLIAGMSAALNKFGTRAWEQSIQPAINLAETGMEIDWYASLHIAGGAGILKRYNEAKRVFLPEGLVPVPDWTGHPPVLKLGMLVNTLKRLRDYGPQDFYEGKIAQSIVKDASNGGSKISKEDLARYKVNISQADVTRYRDSQIFTAPGLTAGPTLKDFFNLLEANDIKEKIPGPESYSLYARNLLQSYERRLKTLGDANELESPSCTTHLTVVDRHGNMVSLTQTLLSLFGSRIMLPDTGILMNNGIMWFDTRPDHPNSIKPGKRPLSNMCPTIVQNSDGFQFAIGASGGRRIMPAVAQLISFIVDFGIDMETAFHLPRIDVSDAKTVTFDKRLGPDTIDKISREFDHRIVEPTVYPPLFACPNAVSKRDGQSNEGAAYVMSPWARAIAAKL